jgi:hypothetical protein
METVKVEILNNGNLVVATPTTQPVTQEDYIKMNQEVSKVIQSYTPNEGTE